MMEDKRGREEEDAVLECTERNDEGAERAGAWQRASSSLSAFSHLGGVCVCVRVCVRQQGSLSVVIYSAAGTPQSPHRARWQNPEAVSTCCKRCDFYRQIKQELKAISGRSGCSSSACSLNNQMSQAAASETDTINAIIVCDVSRWRGRDGEVLRVWKGKQHWTYSGQVSRQ